MSTPILQLKQKRRGALRHGVRDHKKTYLSSGNRRVNRNPSVSNPRTPMHRKMMSDRSYRIMARLYHRLFQPAQIANNLIKYYLHAERFIFPVKPSASPSGVFVCNNDMSLRGGAKRRRSNLRENGENSIV